jgi:hypothetical protein
VNYVEVKDFEYDGLVEGRTVTYFVKLSVVPQTDVIITPIVHDDSVRDNVRVTPAKMVVGPSYDLYNSRLVFTIHAVENDVDDYARSVVITHAVNTTDSRKQGVCVPRTKPGVEYEDPRLSCFTQYANVTVAAIRVSLLDNDAADVIVDKEDVHGVEGSTFEYFVHLGSEPEGDVVFAVATSDGVSIRTTPEWVVFNASNWKENAVISVNIVENNRFGSFVRQNYSLTHSVSSAVDTRYHGFRAPNVTLSVADDDFGCAPMRISNSSAVVVEATPETETFFEYSCLHGGVCTPVRPRYTSPLVFVSRHKGAEECDDDVWGLRCEKEA